MDARVLFSFVAVLVAGSAEAACVPKVVTIQLFGDSTQAGYDGTTGRRIAISPAMLMQGHMDRLFGAGAVRVFSRGVNNTTAGQLLDGTDGINLPWKHAATADITVVNHGINEIRFRVPVSEYKRSLRKLDPTVFETPSPSPGAGSENYAQAMREVADGRPVADVDAYVRSLPDWPRYIPDGLHPTRELYEMISQNVLLPALLPLVEGLRCGRAGMAPS